MKKFIYLISFFLILLLSLKSFSQEKWEFIKDTEYCFIQSNPVKTEIPEGKSRGAHGILVVKMQNNPDLYVQITAGFNYKSSPPLSIQVKIDKKYYNFITDEDTAWAKDDKKVIYAMKRGLELTTTAVSSNGTKVVDIYSLNGFTSAYNKLSNDC